MAMKSVLLDLNGQVYTLDYDSSTKKWKKTVTAPTASSYNQTDHVYAMELKAVDVAGNVTLVDKTDSTFGNLMKLRVKEKVAPAISVTKPSAGAYLTSNTVAFSVNVTDSGSGVSNSTISVKLDGIVLVVTKKTITNGYQCIYSGTVRSALYSCTVSRYLQHYRLYYWNYGKPKQNGWKNQFVQKYEGNHEKGDHVASDCRWCNH